MRSIGRVSIFTDTEEWVETYCADAVCRLSAARAGHDSEFQFVEAAGGGVEGVAKGFV